ncbi:MAG: hypothetical protein ISR55_11460 [Bacteroidetes bacterium]|nr:hypothetical protein [Bacteroidota bacterium]
MKKILSLLLIFLPLTIFSQTDPVKKSTSKYKLGINIGTVWECDDVRWESGSGWGITLERVLNPYENAFLHFSLRGRFLKGESIGIDWQPDSGLANNQTLNDPLKPQLNYQDGIGFVYQNHFTEFTEWTLEGIIGFNKLKQNHRIDFYLFGGIGSTNYYSYTNQLDGTASPYDYLSINSTDKKGILQELDDLRDHSFETPSFGRNGHEVVFTPSLGLGLGYMISDNISIGFEHKVSFPRTDLFDGQQWNHLSLPTGDNDIYHYTSFGFNLYFGIKEKEKKQEKPKTGTYKPVKNTRPEIIINQPDRDPHYSDNCEADIIATIKGIEEKANIRVYKNGALIPAAEYDFFETSHKLYIRQNLDGDTKFRIFAYNSNGNTDKELEITCEEIAERPTVHIIKPSQNNTTAADCLANIVATTSHISNKNQIKISLNGQLLSAADFAFSSLSQEISLNRKINDRSLFIIVVTNDYASATDRITINCGPQGTAPEIHIIQSNSKNINLTSCKSFIEARIHHMESKYGITVRENGNKLSSAYFEYDPRTKKFAFNKEYSNRALISITAQNEYGSATKELSFICTPVKEEDKKPQVIITKPLSDPHQTEEYLADITATVLHIKSKSAISITENGITISSSYYKYDHVNKRLTLEKAISNKSTFVITARNNAGSASGQVTIIGFTKVKLPEIRILSPNTNPYNTKNCSGVLIASINNIASKSEISLVENGREVSSSKFNFQPANQRFTYNYTADNKLSIEIKAVNKAGSASSTVTIICQKEPPPPPPKLYKPEISITLPKTDPFLSVDCKANIKARILHITSVAQVSISENGSTLASTYYTYNVQSQELVINKSITKASTYKISANNKSGTASKSITIDCEPLKKPVISILNPKISPSVAIDCKMKLTAKFENIDSKDQIRVLENGKDVEKSSYSWNPTYKTINLSKKIEENSLFKITASNKAGSVSSQVEFKCSPTLPPTVKITSPAISPFITQNCKVEIIAITSQIKTKSQIKIRENDALIGGESFSFNASTQTIKITTTIVRESNFRITVSNEKGSSQADVLIKCEKAVSKPKVIIKKPAQNPVSISTEKLQVIATVLNISTKSQINITLNGKTIAPSSYNFIAFTKELKMNLSIQQNSTLIIKATNKAGSASGSLNIIYNVVKNPPVITILSPTQNPHNSTSCMADITAKIENISGLENISVLENGNPMHSDFYSWNAGSKQLRIQQDVETKSDFTITASNIDGTDSKTVSVKCVRP